ncbi:MAG: NAD+ synthase, partial [Arenicellales bacterium]
GSHVVDCKGDIVARLPVFESAYLTVDIEQQKQGHQQRWCPLPEKLAPHGGLEQRIYQALVTGVKDYVNKNGFKGVVLGLSGGIDSALTLAIAVDALGKDRVEAVMMPYHYTSEMSEQDAGEQANTMGVNYHVVSIAPMVEASIAQLAPIFKGMAEDTTEENIQARCRMVLLMAISNKKGLMVLTTGNKSEMAVGYATLYGDMAGGFAAIKDVPKTMVYALSKYRNTLGEVIPERVITRPPSAELRPDQVDQDSLPDYDVLDAILEAFVEHDQSAENIIAQGYDAEIVQQVIKMVVRNEYKRRQAAPGVRITPRAFGRDRRYPITSKFF